VNTAVHSPQKIHFHASDDKQSNIALTSKFKTKQPEVSGFITYEILAKQFLPVSQPA
jgi:hypothetical protein